MGAQSKTAYNSNTFVMFTTAPAPKTLATFSVDPQCVQLWNNKKNEKQICVFKEVKGKINLKVIQTKRNTMNWSNKKTKKHIMFYLEKTKTRISSINFGSYLSIAIRWSVVLLKSPFMSLDLTPLISDLRLMYCNWFTAIRISPLTLWASSLSVN